MKVFARNRGQSTAFCYLTPIPEHGLWGQLPICKKNHRPGSQTWLITDRDKCDPVNGMLPLIELARLPVEMSKETDAQGADSPQHFPGKLERVAEIICFTDREMFVGEEEKCSLYGRVYGVGPWKQVSAFFTQIQALEQTSSPPAPWLFEASFGGAGEGHLPECFQCQWTWLSLKYTFQNFYFLWGLFILNNLPT